MDWWSWLAGALMGAGLTSYYDTYVRPRLRRRRVRRDGLTWQCEHCSFSFVIMPRHGGPTAANVEVYDRVITTHREVHRLS